MGTISARAVAHAVETQVALPVARRTPGKQPVVRGRPFVDYKVVRVIGGRGGDGCSAFARAAGEPRGPPSGGDGGRGGNVWLAEDRSLTSLAGLANIVRAGGGSSGSGGLCHGGTGSSTTVRVPMGTLVRRVRPPESILAQRTRLEAQLASQRRDDPAGFLQNFLRIDASLLHGVRLKALLAQLGTILGRDPMARDNIGIATPFDHTLDASLAAKDCRHQLLAAGGTGGIGNPHFSQLFGGIAAGAAPRIATRGAEGDDFFYEFELQLLADVALVGFPNAGKSSLLCAMTNAQPRVAPFAFTTLVPCVGMLELGRGVQLTIADIPGLVNGASENAGLGHAFLRHVERSRAFVFVLDGSSAIPLWQQLQQLLSELERYRSGLGSRPSVVVVNKMDAADAEAIPGQLDALSDFVGRVFESATPRIVALSALTGVQVDCLSPILRHLAS